MICYDVEDRVFRRRCEGVSMRQANGIADKLFAEFGVEPCPIQRGHSRGGGAFYEPSAGFPNGRIRLGKHAPDWLVCHEVAHYTASREGSRGHDEIWQQHYVRAIRVVLSDWWADRLAAGFQKGQ